jgi:hypothetical protein
MGMDEKSFLKEDTSNWEIFGDVFASLAFRIAFGVVLLLATLEVLGQFPGLSSSAQGKIAIVISVLVSQVFLYFFEIRRRPKTKAP